jgi:hypothetical protein
MLADCANRVDNLARPSDVVPDLHRSVAVPIAMDHRSDVWQYPGGLRQSKRTETHEQAVGKIWLVPGCEKYRDK